MGPSRTHIPYTNVYQGRAWFDQIIENSTSRYAGTRVYTCKILLGNFVLERAFSAAQELEISNERIQS